MNLMRAVSSYHWVASKKALLLIYKSLIRSVIDYGDVVYSSASKSMLDQLSSVQTEALRLCCGAAKGTAALALQNECGEMPLRNRRLQVTALVDQHYYTISINQKEVSKLNDVSDRHTL